MLWAGCTISARERESVAFFEHCFYTNLGRFPLRICACMKVFNIQLTEMHAVPWVSFRMMQNGCGAWRMLSLFILIDWLNFSYNNSFCEPACPRRIWEKNKHFIKADFWRRHPGAFQNDNSVEEYALNEIQTSLSERSPALTLESLNLPRAPFRSYKISAQYYAPLPNTDDIESIVSCPKKFNKE